MAVRGKSINLFLMDGEASGRIKCTLANWTGIAYKIPRTELDKCKERDDLKQSGVYFLFGASDQTGKNVVYIGQAGPERMEKVYSTGCKNIREIQRRTTGQKRLCLLQQIIPLVQQK